MAKRVSYSTLNASTIDILNVIRQNADTAYQNAVPEVSKATDIPKVGEVINGQLAFQNTFLNALMNRIAAVRVQSATFNNPYAALKKGYLEFGESIEDIFVGIARVVDYDPAKGASREFARTIPDVRSVFHTLNWKVMYPITIEDEQLKQAFMSLNGVTDLIAKIVDQLYTAAEYDEFLLFKYMLIKAVSHGNMYPVGIGDGTDLKKAAVAFRGTSNQLPFMHNKYNASGVYTTTPKDRQAIFMDADFNAQYDVDVLASAFNMDKADFMGRLYLIDNWTEFDNARFDTIRKNNDSIEEVTQEELNLMNGVKAVMVDIDWFQIYDNNNKFTEKYNAAGLYWNYFYHTWKTVSWSPFANAVVFALDSANTALPATIDAKIVSKDTSPEATVFTLDASIDGASLEPNNDQFVQTEALTRAGIAVQKYGAIIIPASQAKTAIELEVSINGTLYKGGTATINADSEVGTVITLTKE